MDESTTYICDSCGEEIDLAVDPTAGPSQRFVEDCPVCCRPMVIVLTIDEEGMAHATAERE